MKFTIFTPTYNRKNDLINLYNSLKVQEFKDFEWLIVDDGSSDNTKKIVESFQKESRLNIRYIYQINGGKHRAFNRGISEAKGEYLISVDSDDILIPTAIKEIDDTVYSNSRLMGFCFLCVYPDNVLIGDEYPVSDSIYNLIDIIFKHKVGGDKLWVFPMDILKQHRFLEFENENFLTEGTLLIEMARKFNIYGSNKKLMLRDYLEGGLTRTGNNVLFSKNPRGALAYFKTLFKVAPNLKYKCFYLYNILKYSLKRM